MAVNHYESFDFISKPSGIRLAGGDRGNAGSWRIWLCRSNGIMLSPASIETLEIPEDVIFTLSIPTDVAIEAGLDQDMYFIDNLRGRQYNRLDGRQYSRAVKYFELIRLAMENPVSAASDEEIRFVSMALLKMCRQWYDSREALEDGSRQAQIAGRFIKLVSQYCHVERSMSFYSEQLAIAPKYLSFVISSRTGRTATDWIKEYTLARAKEMLLDTNLSVNEISDQLNFITSSDFCKWFRRCSGMSPKAFRTQLISNRS